MGKLVGCNIFLPYKDSLDSRLEERKEEYIVELEKVKNEGIVLLFEKTTELPP